MSTSTKILIALITAGVLLLQGQLWFGKGSIPELYALNMQIQNQRHENNLLKQRNQSLALEINDIQKGTGGIEELARNKLGMVKKDETFFMILDEDRP